MTETVHTNETQTRLARVTQQTPGMGFNPLDLGLMASLVLMIAGMVEIAAASLKAKSDQIV